ncbi:Hsp70 family protein [Dactylosporangium aurantiacum]|uniref:Hsp70 family protein n=1 Tax=Dactylosporangium aurantiacum TaxID=35754 RepID=A0A9Q9MDE7_9ACTN|nr:Hsp70 family protein [Dactylosporangium aurantiacum]MDG6100935.1 Hsp70 family protein [Dactylosporangium aurantiacum]UWZ55013.1 Hsp70 family protein [Dactylosporangium aurantiacum]
MTEPQQGFAIGVDLGTSNTVAVVRWPDGRTRPLLVDGAPIMPSGVFVDEHGRLHVGRDAARLAGLDPSRFEPNPKRRIDEPTVLLGDREIATVDLLAAILAAVARAAVEAVGFLPAAVLTYPAAWGTRRRDVLATAARRAGWPPVMLVPEPVAAARYFADVLRRPVPVGAALAVFDFGGGTLDIAVVRNDNGRFTVIGSGGVEDLGGLDIDAALVEHLGQLISTTAPATWEAIRNPATTTQRRDRRLFWDDVRGAKEMLSRTTVAPITVPGADQAIHLTREELDRVVGPLIHRAVWETGSVIASAGLRGDQLAGLFLVGGSSRLPLASRQLHAQLGIPPTVLEQPELPVAEGALAELAPPAPPLAGHDLTSATGYGASPTGFVGSPAAPHGSPAAAHGSPAAPVSPGFGAAPTSGGFGAPPTSGGFGHTSGAPTNSGYPMTAAQAIPPGQYGASAPPTAPFQTPTPPPTPPPRPRSRRGPLVAGIAAVVVLALVAGGYFWFFRDRDTKVDFATLKAEKTFEMGDPDTINYPISATLNDRAVIGWRVDKQFFVQGINLGDMKTAWPKITIDRDYSKWGITAYQDGIVVTGTGSSLGSVFILDWKNGKIVWQGTFSDYDMLYATGPVLAIHRYEGKKTDAVTWAGKNAWTRPDNGKGSAIYGQSNSADLRGPGNYNGVSINRDMKARDDLISIDGDDKIRLINATNGTEIRSWNNVGEYGAEYLAHDDKLFVAGGSTKYTVNAYDLSSAGEPSQIYSFGNDKVEIVDMAPCADNRLCLIDGSYGGKDNTVRAISVADKREVWNAPAPGSTMLVPVGRQVLATDRDSPASVLLSYEGKSLLRNEDRDSYGVRVASGSLMFFTGTLSATSPANLTLVGVSAASGERIALGPLTKTIGLSCSWNASLILCASEGKFQVWRFAAA